MREPGVFPEPDHHDPLAVLWYEIGGINNSGVQSIAQLFSQLAPDHFESPTFIMAFEVLHVFQQESRRAVVH